MSGDDMLKRKLNKLLKEPENHELFNDIGVMLYELKDYENARKYLCSARELSPADSDVLYNYARVLYALFEWRKAATIFNEYLKIQPNDKDAIEKIADAYYLLGEYDRAEKYACLLSQQGGRYGQTN